MRKSNKLLLATLILTPLYGQKTPRPPKPEIATRWVDGEKTYQLKATYLQEEPIFQSYDKSHFDAHLLPQGQITFRNDPSTVVDSTILSQLAETAIDELRSGKKNLTHFKVLKRRDFCSKRFVGTIILKYRDYPFVLKLFIDNPRSFANPSDKNIRHGIMAKMTGGLSRYLSGFTRIKNLEHTQLSMATLSNPPVILDFPRKWFWLPQQQHWFEVTGKNFKSNVPKITLPEVYAIIADEIVGVKESAKLTKYQKRIYALCQRLDYHIDPNMLNFKVEKGTNKLVIIDTELFRAVVGIKEPIFAATHQGLRFQLLSKGIHDVLFA